MQQMGVSRVQKVEIILLLIYFKNPTIFTVLSTNDSTCGGFVLHPLCAFIETRPELAAFYST